MTTAELVIDKELVMDERVVWDSKRLKQVDEAKMLIMGFKRRGYQIMLGDGITPMERFRPYLEEVVIKAHKLGTRVLKILCEKGDERLVWDKERGQQAKEAKKKFLEYLEKGHKAYSVDFNGKKNKRIHEFDVDAEEILMIPPTAKG